MDLQSRGMLQQGHIHCHAPLPSYNRRSSLAGPCCTLRSVSRAARSSLVSAQHKDIEDVIFSEESIRERITVLGRCAGTILFSTKSALYLLSIAERRHGRAGP